MTSAESIAALIKQLLESLRQPLLAPFLADWPSAPRRRTIRPAALPVLRWLPQAGDTAAYGIDVAAAVCRAAPSMAWRQTYAAADVGGAFLQNYGWSEIFGEAGPLTSERIACGFLMLGPETHYPLHRHEAEEIYLPLSGIAEWRQGDAVWRPRSPGTVIHHPRDEPHSMRTGAAPLLALYLWLSANLAQKSRIDAGGTRCRGKPKESTDEELDFRRGSRLAHAGLHRIACRERAGGTTPSKSRASRPEANMITWGGTILALMSGSLSP